MCGSAPERQGQISLRAIKKKKKKKLHCFLNFDGIKIKLAIFPKYRFMYSVDNQFTLMLNPLLQSFPAMFAFALDSIVIIWQWQKQAWYITATHFLDILSENTPERMGGQAHSNAWLHLYFQLN